MGEQLYPNQGNPSPTQKELGIINSTFKRGFGGQMQVNKVDGGMGTIIQLGNLEGYC